VALLAPHMVPAAFPPEGLETKQTGPFQDPVGGTAGSAHGAGRIPARGS
jgi:hypothetical protein